MTVTLFGLLGRCWVDLSGIALHSLTLSFLPRHAYAKCRVQVQLLVRQSQYKWGINMPCLALVDPEATDPSDPLRTSYFSGTKEAIASNCNPFQSNHRQFIPGAFRLDGGNKERDIVRTTTVTSILRKGGCEIGVPPILLQTLQKKLLK